MKLFGNSRHAARTSKKNTEQQGISGKKKTLLIVLSVVVGVILVVCLLLAFLIQPPKNPPISGEVIDPDTNQTYVPDPNKKEYKDGYFNILLAGTDNDGLRTDTIMIARINTKDNSVALLSIPRDTMIETSKGAAKINSVYGVYGGDKRGMEALMLEVEDLLGFMPNGYVLVKLDAFVELVDLIGGVYFDVPKDMYHIDPTQDLYINLSKGYQHLDGNEAMQLVRFRGYLTADIERTHVQQKFLAAVAKKCLELSNLGKIDGYVDIFQRNVTTNLDAGNFLFFAQKLLDCDFNAMNTYTLAGEGGHYVNGVDYYKVDEEKMQAVIEKDFYPYTN